MISPFIWSVMTVKGVTCNSSWEHLVSTIQAILFEGHLFHCLLPFKWRKGCPTQDIQRCRKHIFVKMWDFCCSFRSCQDSFIEQVELLRSDLLQNDLDIQGEYVTEDTMRDEWKWSECPDSSDGSSHYPCSSGWGNTTTWIRIFTYIFVGSNPHCLCIFFH